MTEAAASIPSTVPSNKGPSSSFVAGSSNNQSNHSGSSSASVKKRRNRFSKLWCRVGGVGGSASTAATTNSAGSSSDDDETLFSRPRSRSSSRSPSRRAMKTPGKVNETLPAEAATPARSSESPNDNKNETSFTESIVDDSAFFPDELRTHDDVCSSLWYSEDQVQERIRQAMELQKQELMGVVGSHDDDLKKQFDEERRAMKRKHEEERKALLHELESLKEQAKKEPEPAHEPEQAQQEIVASLENELENERQSHQKRIDELQLATEQKLERERQKYEERLEANKEELEREKEAIESRLKGERETQVQNLRGQILDLTSKLETDRSERKKELKKLRQSLLLVDDGMSDSLSLSAHSSDDNGSSSPSKEELKLYSHIEKMAARAKADVSERDAEIKRLKEEMESELQKERSRSATTLEEKQLRIKELKEAQAKLQVEKQKEINEMNKQIEDLRISLDRSRAEKSAEIEKLEKEHTAAMDRRRLELRSSQDDKDSEIANFRQAFREEREDLQATIDENLKKIHELSSEKAELERQVATLESGGGSAEVERLQVELKCQRETFQQKLDAEQVKVLQVREEHAREIEELLAQLDLVEAEHNERYAGVEKGIKEKDAIIAALGAQLAEAQTRMNAAEDSQAHLARELELLQSELREAKTEVESLKATLERSLKEYKEALEAERLDKEKACEMAREEMITRAEEQFQKANAVYMELKHQYDAEVAKATKLDRDLKEAKREADRLRDVQTSKQLDLTAEVAQLKASLATIEANAAQKAKDHRSEVGSLTESVRQIQAKLEESETNCRTVHTTLATVVAEKERLSQENDEMKAVCEELMAMVEGGQQ